MEIYIYIARIKKWVLSCDFKTAYASVSKAQTADLGCSNVLNFPF